MPIDITRRLSKRNRIMSTLRQRGMLVIKAGNYEKAAAFFQAALQNPP